MDQHPDMGLLANTLELAVPFALRRLALQGGPLDADLQWASEFGTELGSHGDALLYHVRGQSGPMFAGLARAVAILAYAPGGVTFLGRHWCVGTPDSTGAVCRPDCPRVVRNVRIAAEAR